MSKLILPNQQNAAPAGQVACEAKGEVVVVAILYPGLGNLGAVLDVEAAQSLAFRLQTEADKAKVAKLDAQLVPDAQRLGVVG